MRLCCSSYNNTAFLTSYANSSGELFKRLIPSLLNDTLMLLITLKLANSTFYLC